MPTLMKYWHGVIRIVSEIHNEWLVLQQPNKNKSKNAVELHIFVLFRG